MLSDHVRQFLRDIGNLRVRYGVSIVVVPGDLYWRIQNEDENVDIQKPGEELKYNGVVIEWDEEREWEQRQDMIA